MEARKDMGKSPLPKPRSILGALLGAGGGGGASGYHHIYNMTEKKLPYERQWKGPLTIKWNSKPSIKEHSKGNITGKGNGNRKAHRNRKC